jgi:uncharacterized protein YbaR (Trm112 family)
MFAWFLHAAPPDCLCRERARLMDVMGCPWCRREIDTIVSWIEEEAEQLKLFEDGMLKAKMVNFATRFLRKYRLPLGVRRFLARRMVTADGAARRLLIRRFVLIAIRKAERRK